MKKLTYIPAAVAMFLWWSCASTPPETPPQQQAEIPAVAETQTSAASETQTVAGDFSESQDTAGENQLANVTDSEEQHAENPLLTFEADTDFIPIFADDTVHVSDAAATVQADAPQQGFETAPFRIVSVPEISSSGIEESYSGMPADIVRTESAAADSSDMSGAAAADIAGSALSESLPGQYQPDQNAAVEIETDPFYSDVAAEIAAGTAADAVDSGAPVAAAISAAVTGTHADYPENGSGSFPAIPESTRSATAAAEAVSAVPPEPVPGRFCTAKRNQFIDIQYPGNGWMYIGSSGDSNAVSFFGKKLNGDDTLFIIRTRAPGTVVLQFSRIDSLSGEKTDEYIQVTVADTVAAQHERLSVPSENQAAGVPPQETYLPEQHTQETPHRTAALPSAAASSAVTPEEVQNTRPAAAAPVFIQEKNDEPVSAVSSEPDVELLLPLSSDVSFATGSNLDPDALLAAAEEAYAQKEYTGALSLLEQFFSKSVRRLDEAWFLRGQIYETEQKSGNIKKALDAYSILVSSYPGSPLWQKAADRIVYINRFYFDIR